MGYHSIDVEWGNTTSCGWARHLARRRAWRAVIRNNIHYESLSILESAYGVSLRELAPFSEATYTQDDGMTPMEKAISVILFKLEGQVIMRHPNWHMEDRLLLEYVDPARGVLDLNGTAYEMRTRDFPTLDPAHPYELSADERRVMDGLMDAVHNRTSCAPTLAFSTTTAPPTWCATETPMNEDGTFCAVRHQDQVLAGREYYDYADAPARAWHEHDQVSARLDVVPLVRALLAAFGARGEDVRAHLPHRPLHLAGAA